MKLRNRSGMGENENAKNFSHQTRGVVCFTVETRKSSGRKSPQMYNFIHL